jgi:hypothetical protein
MPPLWMPAPQVSAPGMSGPAIAPVVVPPAAAAKAAAHGAEAWLAGPEIVAGLERAGVQPVAGQMLAAAERAPDAD